MMKQKLSLTPFEDSELTRSLQIWTTVQREETCFLLDYTIEGLVSQIKIPHAPGAPKRQSQLWEHTCFEAFISFDHQLSYWELNLSPNQSWNFYSLSGYRENLQEIQQLRTISFRKNEMNDKCYHLQVQLDLASLFALQGAPPIFNLGIAAVIEAMDGSHSYWAIQHFGKKPDFHLRESFLLRL